MKFNDVLNNYMNLIGCTSKELSIKSNIDTSVISRYKKGYRTPKFNSVQYESLINGIISLINEYNIDIDINKLKEEFKCTLNTENIDFDIFKNNLNYIINSLKINISNLSKYMGFDSSYLSKIKSGNRKPQNISEFANMICKYIYNNYKEDYHKNLLSEITNIKINNENYIDTLYEYLISNNSNEKPINNFLSKLDNFDLNEYIKSIKFDKIKVPTSPITLHKGKYYYGLEGFKNSQLDILKTIVLSKNTDDITFYSNMPMIEASKDLKFTKKFMIGIAFLLKKNQRLNIIHNLDRPFNELLLGLEGWIPLYMTGLINPYYIKKNQNELYSYINLISKTAILDGKCVNNNIDTSMIYVSSKKEDITLYQNYKDNLFKNTLPLMQIYTKDKKQEFNNYINSIALSNVDRKNTLYNLPNYVLDDIFLENLLNKNNINDDKKDLIIKCINQEKELNKKILKNNIINDEINILKKEEFKDYYLSLSRYFIDLKIKYEYEDYLNHIKLLEKYKKDNKNYNFKKVDNAFKNINIHILKNNQVIISKENTPSIYFVIKHEKLIYAIENYKPLIKE